MEEYENDDALAELVRLCDELGLDHMDSEACACETHIFIDTEGNPHECWEASPGHINVVVAMTPEQAVHITDTMAENDKLRELVRDLWMQLLNAYDRKEVDEFADRMRELGVEVDDGQQ